LWRDVLRASVRDEFEQARHEPDPEIIARLLVVGRDALMQSQERFVHKRHQLDQVVGDPTQKHTGVIMPDAKPFRTDQ
jgi:hypothetical protein